MIGHPLAQPHSDRPDPLPQSRLHDLGDGDPGDDHVRRPKRFEGGIDHLIGVIDHAERHRPDQAQADRVHEMVLQQRHPDDRDAALDDDEGCDQNRDAAHERAEDHDQPLAPRAAQQGREPDEQQER